MIVEAHGQGLHDRHRPVLLAQSLVVGIDLAVACGGPKRAWARGIEAGVELVDGVQAAAIGAKGQALAQRREQLRPAGVEPCYRVRVELAAQEGRALDLDLGQALRVAAQVELLDDLVTQVAVGVEVGEELLATEDVLAHGGISWHTQMR